MYYTIQKVKLRITRNNQAILLVIITVLISCTVPAITIHQSPELVCASSLELKAASEPSNLEIVQEAFDALAINYDSNGYYPELWEGTIRADYYATSVAKRLDKLDEIDSSAIKAHIMSFYDPASGAFADDYANRYLDTDFDLFYFPLSTLLQTNCYAVLALDAIGELDAIDAQEMQSFIWDCFDPSTGGFIGRPYSGTLDPKFLTPTADNTYFAVIALSLLMGGDWSLYSDERAVIISFVASLQHPTSPIGFFNDLDHSFDSSGVWEPNLIASYYCVRVLDLFNAISSMNLNLFHAFLSLLYHPDTHTFDVGVSPAYSTECNVIASAMGLELSILTNFAGCDQDGTFNFVMSQLNAYSLWDASTIVQYHELINTFQVIRSLSRAGKLEGPALDALESVVYFVNDLFWTSDGYSLLSKEFTSQESLNAIISAYHFYDNVLSLDVNELYKDVKDSFKTLGAGTSQFSGSLYNTNPSDNMFRSHPIEHYCFGKFTNLPQLERMYTHKSMFYALDSLNKLYKLDLFAPLIDEDQIISEIVSSQFLDFAYENCGAFLDSSAPVSSNPDVKNTFAFFEYSYYAIRALELLTSISNTYDSVLEVGIDEMAFYEFVSENLVQTTQTLYFEFPYSVDSLLNLKNTYFACYALKALNMYTLNDGKIKAYVDQVVDYGNLESVYYAYKLLELIDQPIDLDASFTQQLVRDLYNSTLHQFYIATDSNQRDWQALAWICELATASETQLSIEYLPEVYLGGYNPINASVYNLIATTLSMDAITYESPQLGIKDMTLQPDGMHYAQIYVPVDASNYPSVQGTINATKDGALVCQEAIEFSTTYVLDELGTSFDRSNNEINVTSDLALLTGKGHTNLTESAQARLTITIGGVEQPNPIYLAKIDFDTFSRFSAIYVANIWGSYYLNLSLCDGITPEFQQIGDYSFSLYSQIELSFTPKDPLWLGARSYMYVEFFDRSLQQRVEYDRVTFSNVQFGEIELQHQPDDTYELSLFVPVNKFDYPRIYGTLLAYEGESVALESDVYFNTTYEVNTSWILFEPSANEIMVYANVSLNTSTSLEPLPLEAFAQLYVTIDGVLQPQPVPMNRLRYQEYDLFYNSYTVNDWGSYYFNLTLCDGIVYDLVQIGEHYAEYSCDVEIRVPPPEPVRMGDNFELRAICFDNSLQKRVRYDEVNFTSSKLGDFKLELQPDDSYFVSIPIPVESSCYPWVEGTVQAFNDSVLRAEKYIYFKTYYNYSCSQEFLPSDSQVRINVSAWLETTSGNIELPEGSTLNASFRKDGTNIDTIAYPIETQRGCCSEFWIEYDKGVYGNHTLEVYLNASCSNRLDLLFSSELTYEPELETIVSRSELFYLGASTLLTVSYRDPVTDTYWLFDEVEFYSDQLEPEPLYLQGEHEYKGGISIPMSPDCYPTVQGEIRAYYGGTLAHSTAIEFDTTYELEHRFNYTLANESMNITLEGWFALGLDTIPLLDTAQAEIVVILDQSELPEPVAFTVEHLHNRTCFLCNYTFEESGEYALQVRLFDPVAEEWILIGDPILADFGNEESEEENEEPEDDSAPSGDCPTGDDESNEDESDPGDEDGEGSEDPEEDPTEVVEIPEDEDPTNSTTDEEPRDTDATGPNLFEAIPLFSLLIAAPAGVVVAPMVFKLAKTCQFPTKRFFKNFSSKYLIRSKPQ